jgi:hypothetical protein
VVSHIWRDETAPDVGHPAFFATKLVEVRAFPPFPQKEAERMGHGVFLAEPQFLRMKALAS